MRLSFKSILALSVFCLQPLFANADTTTETAGQRYQRAYVAETTERDINAAIPLYQSVVDDKGASNTLRAEAYYRLGLCHERLGDADKAISAYRLAIETEPNPRQPYVEEAKTNVARLTARAPAERTLRKGQKFFTPVHQVLIAGAAVAKTSMGNDGLGIELFGYEYLHPSGLALKVSPLNFSWWNEKDSSIDSIGASGTDYAPLWLRYYLRPEISRALPFFGLGFVRSYREHKFRYLSSFQDLDGTEIPFYNSDYHAKTTSGLGIELGITLGDVGRRSSRFVVKVLPIGLSRKDTTYLAAYEFSLGFRSKDGGTQ